MPEVVCTKKARQRGLSPISAGGQTTDSTEPGQTLTKHRRSPARKPHQNLQRIKKEGD